MHEHCCRRSAGDLTFAVWTKPKRLRWSQECSPSIDPSGFGSGGEVDQSASIPHNSGHAAGVTLRGMKVKHDFNLSKLHFTDATLHISTFLPLKVKKEKKSSKKIQIVQSFGFWAFEVGSEVDLALNGRLIWQKYLPMRSLTPRSGIINAAVNGASRSPPRISRRGRKRSIAATILPFHSLP